MACALVEIIGDTFLFSPLEQRDFGLKKKSLSTFLFSSILWIVYKNEFGVCIFSKTIKTSFYVKTNFQREKKTNSQIFHYRLCLINFLYFSLIFKWIKLKVQNKYTKMYIKDKYHASNYINLLKTHLWIIKLY